MKKLSIVAVSISILAACRTIGATTLSDGIASLLVAIVTLSLSAYFYNLINESLEEVEAIDTPVQKDAPVIKKLTEEELEAIRQQRELELARIKALEEKRRIEEEKRKIAEAKRIARAKAKRKADEENRKQKEAEMWARIRAVEYQDKVEFGEFLSEMKAGRNHNYLVATGIFEGCC